MSEASPRGWSVIPPRPSLYGVADGGFGDPLMQVRRLVAEGVQVVQLRCKGYPTEELIGLGRVCFELCPSLVINDDVVAARAVGCAVHLGQGDGPGPIDVPFGRSCHSLQDVLRLERHATYIGFGPVFPTRTAALGTPVVGLRTLRVAVQSSPVPVIAIGGINRVNVGAVRDTGVAGWAVISAIAAAVDPSAEIRAFIGTIPG